MKKTLSLFTLSLALAVSAQAQEANGQFNLSFRSGVAQTDVETFCRTQLPRLSEGTTFQVSRDVTDQYGTRHITLQQYVDGLKADGCQVLVHMRNDKVQSINGNVITKQMMPEPAARKAAVRQEGEGKEMVLYVKDGVAHQAYKTVKGGKRLVIDAQSGEVLSSKSLRHNWDGPTGQTVKAKGLTMFNGVQEFNATQLEDGSYTLIDSERQLYTLDASFQAWRKNGLSIEEIEELTFEGEFDTEEEYLAYVHESTNKAIAYSGLYLSDKPEWMDEDIESTLDSIRYYIADLEHSYLTNHAVYGVYINMQGEIVMRTDTTVVDRNDIMFHLPQTLRVSEEPLQFALCFVVPEDETQDYAYYALPPLYSHNAFVFPISSITQPKDVEEYEQMMREQAVMGKLTFFYQPEGNASLSDIHWGMTQVLDYYKNTLNYNSFDNMGTEVFCLVNTPESCSSFANAQALCLEEGMPGIMFFGLGGLTPDGPFPPLVLLTIMGHEFTHLAARNLSDAGEDDFDCASNALNESFADIMGVAINRSVTGHISWQVGEEFDHVIRRFDIPEDCDMDPSCYLDSNYDTESFEEHTNAGVQNHMYYLLCTGGEGVNSLGQDYAVTPMDMTEAEALAFNTLTNYTVTVMSYPAISEAWIAAATDMFGAESAQVQSVRQAWAAVGLGEGSNAIQQIGNDAKRQARRYNLQGQAVEGAEGFVIEDGRISTRF